MAQTKEKTKPRLENEFRGSHKTLPEKISPPTATEDRRDRFLRIGNARMNRVLNSIRLLGNLANSAYEWHEDDIRTMQMSINDALTLAVGRFHRVKAEKPNFSFAEKLDL